MGAPRLEDIMKKGGIDPAKLKELQQQAKDLGLTKRVIHIELDLITGNMSRQSTKMDSVMHLGMIGFYAVMVIGDILGRSISKNETVPEPDDTKKEDAIAPPAGGDAPPAEPPAPEAAAPTPSPIVHPSGCGCADCTAKNQAAPAKA